MMTMMRQIEIENMNNISNTVRRDDSVHEKVGEKCRSKTKKIFFIFQVQGLFHITLITDTRLSIVG
jgi:hypothetical protein